MWKRLRNKYGEELAKDPDDSSRYKFLAAICLAAAFLVLLLPWGRTRYDFCLTFFDVGQGDAILLSADGCNVLVDAGGLPADSVVMGEQVVLPYLREQGIRKLDLVVNTHPDNDHIGGLFAVVDSMAVGKLAVFGGYGESGLQKELLALAEGKGVPVLYLAAGDRLELSERLALEVLWPTAGASFTEADANEGSLVLHIRYEDFDALLTGDVAGAGILQSTAGLDCAEIEVLQLPHHGSLYSYDETWYAQFEPLAVMVSVGRDNIYGHPGEPVVAYWQNRDVPVLRTDEMGAFQIFYHQGKIWFESKI